MTASSYHRSPRCHSVRFSGRFAHGPDRSRWAGSAKHGWARGGEADPGPALSTVDLSGHQLTVSAVSSTTNDVCSEESSVPVNLIVTVWPAKPATLNDFRLYPLALFRFE